MKTILRITISIFLIMLTPAMIFAQHKNAPIPVIRINKEISTHIIMKEDIKYVDVSTPEVIGNIPIPNIVRIKPLFTKKEGSEAAILSIITQNHFYQYKLIYSTEKKADARYEQQDKDKSETNNQDEQEFQEQSVALLSRKGKSHKTKIDGMVLRLFKLYYNKDYTYLRIEIKNRTWIRFDIGSINFALKEKKRLKASNNQTIPLKPIYQLQPLNKIEKRYDNVFVFRKFLITKKMKLSITLNEKEQNGRVIKW